jgi:hypothetical protein
MPSGSAAKAYDATLAIPQVFNRHPVARTAQGAVHIARVIDARAVDA